MERNELEGSSFQRASSDKSDDLSSRRCDVEENIFLLA